ncbi:MAG: hypothetical protein AAGH78_01830 [Cyanobacteria bacterium P01_H01_bin.58]
MFNFKKKNKVDRSVLESGFSSSKPLIYVPDHGESNRDDWPHLLWEKVFRGDFDVFISRAELDLRKAMQLLTFNTDSSINSFQALAALSLPGTATALIWVTQALLQEKYKKPDLDNAIHHRNHDARLLFQQLSRLNLDPWYSHSVNWVPLDQLSAAFHFPSGHPIPGQIYRKHPFSTQQNTYYPINAYFALLFEEKKRDFLRLLETLGATQVVICPVNQGTAWEAEHAQGEIIQYNSRSQCLNSKPDPSQYPWLGYESSWKFVVDTCLTRSVPSLRCELDLDVMEMLRRHIQPIISLISELRSMALPSNHEVILATEFLCPKQLEVHFNHP